MNRKVCVQNGIARMDTGNVQETIDVFRMIVFVMAMVVVEIGCGQTKIQ